MRSKVKSEKLAAPLNPLTTNDGLLRHENLTFLWTWTLRWVPRSFATHASLCNTLPSNKLCPKTVKIPVVKGLMYVQKTKKSIKHGDKEKANILQKNFHDTIPITSIPEVSVEMIANNIKVHDKNKACGLDGELC